MRPIRFVFASACLAIPAIAALGCSDPVPLIPRGAWSLTFQDTGSDCNVSNHPANVGTVGSDGEVEYKSNGTDNAEVECTVEPSGGAFAVSATVRFGGQYLSMNVPKLKSSATLEEPSTGSLEFATGKSVSIYGSDECIFYFVKDNGQEISEGRVWGSFQCPAVSGEQGDVCAVQQGYFAFENCIGAATEEDEEE